MAYQSLTSFAAYLVSFYDALYFTPAPVTHLIQLWDDLYDYAKKPTVFQENIVPGVESSER